MLGTVGFLMVTGAVCSRIRDGPLWTPCTTTNQPSELQQKTYTVLDELLKAMKEKDK